MQVLNEGDIVERKGTRGIVVFFDKECPFYVNIVWENNSEIMKYYRNSQLTEECKKIKRIDLKRKRSCMKMI